MITRMLSGEDSSLAEASYLKIIGTGLLLGVVHVLTGPDHLSALAAITTNSSWRAFTLGIRWGCGHSIGLIIMALIFFAAGRTVNLTTVGMYTNYIVGVFMIALGFWTMYQVKHKYNQKLKDGHNLSFTTHPPANPLPLTPMEPLQEPLARTLSDSPRSSYLNMVEEGLNSDMERKEEKKCCSKFSFSTPAGQRLTALIVGIVHGMAGPGGILGVLPAVVMDDWGKSTSYLGSFCIASIFIMGVFAALYGEITGRLGRSSYLMEFRIGVFSAAFSLIVGVAWIILQATGQMDKIFE